MEAVKHLKSLVVFQNNIRIDNTVFRLHYKATVLLLVVFSLLLSAKEYFGVPIKCFLEKGQVRETVETLCWTYGTYIINKSGETPMACVRSTQSFNPNLDNSGRVIWQKYYQWVCVVFWVQAGLFYFPWYLWKTWEGGRLRALVEDLTSPLENPRWDALKNSLVRYILDQRKMHNSYAMHYIICEAFNLINVISQIFLIDALLNGQFLSYGFTVFESTKICGNIFPNLAKCWYNIGGPSGTQQNFDGLCVLPLNILNQKLFLILWFWLLILSCFTILSLLYRLATYSSCTVRCYILLSRYNSKKTENVVKYLNYGAFFVLFHIGRNVNSKIFQELIELIYEEIHKFST